MLLSATEQVRIDSELFEIAQGYLQKAEQPTDMEACTAS